METVAGLPAGRAGHAVSLCALILLLAATGCRHPAKEGKAGGQTRREKGGTSQPAIDPRIATEVVMAEMALLGIGNHVPPAKAEEVKANFQRKVSGPLNDAASGRIDRKELLAKLAAVVVDEDSYISMEAAMSLERLADRKDRSLAEELLRDLGDKRPYVRGNSAAVLQSVGDRIAVQPLIGLLTDANAAIEANAASALGEIGDARAIEPLVLVLGRLRQGRCGYDRSSVAHIVPRMPYMWMIDKELEERYRRAGSDPDYATAMFSMPLAPLLEKKNKSLCDYVQWHAVNALRKLTGKRFGQRSDLWLMWWQQNGGKKEGEMDRLSDPSPSERAALRPQR